MEGTGRILENLRLLDYDGANKCQAFLVGNAGSEEKRWQKFI